MDSISPPTDWKQVPLHCVAEARFSSVDKKTQVGEQPVRLCNYVDVYKNDYITDELDFMHATATRSEVAQFGLRLGDVIVTKDSETPDDIGVAALVDCSARDLVCGYHLAMLRPIKNRIASSFLAKQLDHPRITRYFGQQANGLTRYGLPKAALRNTPLWIPSEVQEGREIGDYLRLLDSVIQAAKAALVKLVQVKAGLLHDLLTCGLDERGKLRNPYRHPEQFQESPLGQVPKAWQITNVERVGDVTLGRQRAPQHERGPHLTPYLRVANVFDGWIDYSNVLRMNFNPQEQKSFGLLPGDILLNEGQSLELVGRSAIYRGSPNRYCFQNTLVRFRCFSDAVPEFCRFVFKYWLDCGRFTRVARQTTSVAHLGADRFARMAFARPSPGEQHDIAAHLTAAADRIEAEEARLLKLQSLKQGLANDLLTGQVRVKV